jgi:hypothetical protein
VIQEAKKVLSKAVDAVLGVNRSGWIVLASVFIEGKAQSVALGIVGVDSAKEAWQAACKATDHFMAIEVVSQSDNVDADLCDVKLDGFRLVADLPPVRWFSVSMDGASVFVAADSMDSAKAIAHRLWCRSNVDDVVISER